MRAINGRHVTVSGMTSFCNEAKEKKKMKMEISVYKMYNNLQLLNIILLWARTSQRSLRCSEMSFSHECSCRAKRATGAEKSEVEGEPKRLLTFSFAISILSAIWFEQIGSKNKYEKGKRHLSRHLKLRPELSSHFLSLFSLGLAVLVVDEL